MGKRPTKEALIASYQMLYAKISSATAEKEGKKRIFRGQFKELFAEVPVSQGVISRFIWAISHPTKVLPTTLFSIKKDGNKGVIVERLHSGFYDDKGKHIVGTELVPLIMQSASLRQWKSNKGDEKPVAESVEPKASEQKKSDGYTTFNKFPDLEFYSDDELRTLKERIENEVLRRIEIKKKDLLNTITDLIKGEGFTLDEILEIV